MSADLRIFPTRTEERANPDDDVALRHKCLARMSRAGFLTGKGKRFNRDRNRTSLVIPGDASLQKQEMNVIASSNEYSAALQGRQNNTEAIIVDVEPVMPHDRGKLVLFGVSKSRRLLSYSLTHRSIISSQLHPTASEYATNSTASPNPH